MNRSRTYTGNKNWRLILVGDHGSIVPLGPIKILLFVLLSLLILSVIVAAFLGFFYFNLKMDYSHLAKTFDQQQEQIRILRDKRDMLMAKLVIAESKLPQEDDSAPATASQSLSEELDKETDSSGEASLNTEIDTETQSSNPQDSVSIKVQVSDFKISHSPPNNTISASYVLKNMSPKGQLLEGRSVLLLKGSINGESTIYPMPDVPWENGMPSARLGRRFSIRNFMTVKLSRSAPNQNFSFDRGIVYVFDNKGAVLLKKEIPVDLNYVEDSASSSAKTSIKNSKDSDAAADIKDGTPAEDEPLSPTNESAP